MEPHPAFAHLALGPGEGKTSLYALRLMGIRAGIGGCFDLDVELDTVQPKASSDDETEADATPATADDASFASTPTPTSTGPGPSTTPEPDRDPDHNRAKTPPWASTLPVTCTLAPPPQIPHQNYFSHVDPLKMQAHALPAWPDVYGRR